MEGSASVLLAAGGVDGGVRVFCICPQGTGPPRVSLVAPLLVRRTSPVSSVAIQLSGDSGARGGQLRLTVTLVVGHQDSSARGWVGTIDGSWDGVGGAGAATPGHLEEWLEEGSFRLAWVHGGQHLDTVCLKLLTSNLGSEVDAPWKPALSALVLAGCADAAKAAIEHGSLDGGGIVVGRS